MFLYIYSTSRCAHFVYLKYIQQASVEGFQEHLGLNAEQSVELIKQGGILAREACDEFWDRSCSLVHAQGSRILVVSFFIN